MIINHFIYCLLSVLFIRIIKNGFFYFFHIVSEFLISGSISLLHFTTKQQKKDINTEIEQRSPLKLN